MFLDKVGMYDSSNIHVIVVMAVLEKTAQRGASRCVLHNKYN